MTCQCATPGFCPRHKCVKNEHLFQLCQTKPKFFEAWEQGRGPCLAGQLGDPGVELATPARSRGLGDTIRKLTYRTGIDKAVKRITRTFTVDCGCVRRQRKWNRWLPYRRRKRPTDVAPPAEPG